MSNRIKIKIDLKAEKPKIIKQFDTSKCSSLIEHQSSILSLLNAGLNFTPSIDKLFK